MRPPASRRGAADSIAANGRFAAKLLAAAALLLLIAGCGRGMELRERAFVLGAALDLADSDRIIMTTQLYSAGQSKSEPLNQGSVINVTTVGLSLGEASRDIALHIGRKAQWGHTQMLFVGEALARSDKFAEALDFFYRDDEPRLSLRLSITEGKASSYLEKTALVETSISRQARNIQHFSHRYSGKTTELNLLELGREMAGKSATVVIPYVRDAKYKQSRLNYAGGAIIEHGKMTGLLTASEMQTYLMLTGAFDGGILVRPCNRQTGNDSIEIRSIETSKQLDIVQGKPEVNYSLIVNGSVRELQCSNLTTPEHTEQFQQTMAVFLNKRFTAFIDKFQNRGIDLLRINNELYRREPDYWTAWRSRSDKPVPDVAYKFDVRIRITDTGTEKGKNVLKN